MKHGRRLRIWQYFHNETCTNSQNFLQSILCECYVFKVAVTAVGLGGIIIGSIANTYGWPWGSLEERFGNVFTQGDTLLIPIAVSECGFVERLANVFGQGDTLLIPIAVSERGFVERLANVFGQGDTLLIPIAVSERGLVERLANVFGQGDALLIPTAVSERGLVERLADVFTHGTPRHDSYLVHHALDQVPYQSYFLDLYVISGAPLTGPCLMDESLVLRLESLIICCAKWH